METIISFSLGFIVGGAAGALYATNLYGYKPEDLVEAQKVRNQEWADFFKQKFEGSQTEQVENVNPQQEQAVQNQQVVIEA